VNWTRKQEGENSMYERLLKILQDVPWSIWEELGFSGVKNVEVVRISSEYEYNNRVVDTIRVHICYDLINHSYLEGFERIDIPWANLATRWEPYRNYLMEYVNEGLKKISGETGTVEK